MLSQLTSLREEGDFIAKELSYAANATGKKIEWLTPHGEYLALSSDESKRLAAYRGLFATDLDAELLREIRTSTHGGYAIGDSRFKEEIESALKRRVTPRFSRDLIVPGGQAE